MSGFGVGPEECRAYELPSGYERKQHLDVSRGIIRVRVPGWALVSKINSTQHVCLAF